jgi:hypothetical protein
LEGVDRDWPRLGEVSFIAGCATTIREKRRKSGCAQCSRTLRGAGRRGAVIEQNLENCRALVLAYRHARSI